MSLRLLAVLAVLAMSTPAFAEEEPWAVGVSDDRKKDAQKLLEQGNGLFIAKDYKAALETYEKAIVVWDHPAIRFNIVRCLVQLDRPIDAYDHLERSLEYGARPLEEAVYTEALAYQKLLAGRIAELAIKCDQPNVDLTLDGKPLGRCPLVVNRRLEPGQHQIVGRLAGHQTRTRDLVVLGGKREDVTISLERGATGVVLVHRWPTWIPWVVFGGGFAVAGIGGLLDLKAASDMNSYDRAINAACMQRACEEGNPAVDSGLKRQAEVESAVAIGIMTVGLATIATGATMLYLNRGKPMAEKRPKLVRVNALRGGGATVGISGSF